VLENIDFETQIEEHPKILFSKRAEEVESISNQIELHATHILKSSKKTQPSKLQGILPKGEKLEPRYRYY